MSLKFTNRAHKIAFFRGKQLYAQRAGERRNHIARVLEMIDYPPAGTRSRQTLAEEMANELGVHYNVIVRIARWCDQYRCECCERIKLPAEYQVPPINDIVTGRDRWGNRSRRRGVTDKDDP